MALDLNDSLGGTAYPSLESAQTLCLLAYFTTYDEMKGRKNHAERKQKNRQQNEPHRDRP